jgi:hypothetical protein
MTVLSSGKTLNVLYKLSLDPFDPTNQGKLVYVDEFDITSDVTIVSHITPSDLHGIFSIAVDKVSKG